MSLADLNPFSNESRLPRVNTDVNTVLGVLANERRRYAVRLFRERDVMDIGELTDRRAAVEFDGEYNHKERKRVYVSYYQTHLPKLDRAGVLAYDSGTKVVRSTGLTQGVAELADELEQICTEVPA